MSLSTQHFLGNLAWFCNNYLYWQCIKFVNYYILCTQRNSNFHFHLIYRLLEGNEEREMKHKKKQKVCTFIHVTFIHNIVDTAHTTEYNSHNNQYYNIEIYYQSQHLNSITNCKQPMVVTEDKDNHRLPMIPTHLQYLY